MRRHSTPKLALIALAMVPLSVLSIAACSTTADSAPPPASAARGMCTADQLGQFNGQPASAALGQRIKATSGASIFRWLPRGSVVTMEYNAARVNVVLDARNRVESSRCG